MTLRKDKYLQDALEIAKKIKIDKNIPKLQNISGVKITKLNKYNTESGYFLEITRLEKNSNKLGIPKFQLQQISYSFINGHSIKAWHLHSKQDDLWFIPQESHLLVGMADLRDNSPTKGHTIKKLITSTGGTLILIPRGVAHGYANLNENACAIFYLTSETYNKNAPDEYRLPSDTIGKNFWRK